MQISRTTSATRAREKRARDRRDIGCRTMKTLLAVAVIVTDLGGEGGRWCDREYDVMPIVVMPPPVSPFPGKNLRICIYSR